MSNYILYSAILIVCLAAQTTATLPIFIDETNLDHEPYAKLALYMTERYISPKTSTLIIMEKCAHCRTGLQNMHTRLVRHFLVRFNTGMTLQLFFGLPDERLWDYNMFIVDSIDAFRNLSIHIPLTRYEHQFHFFIILTLRIRHQGTAFEHMQQIFTECLRLHVDNVVIMVQMPNTKDFAFYVSYLFDEIYCRQAISIVRFNDYINGSLTKDSLFPPLLRSFHNCTLNVCLSLGYPMLGFRGNRSNPEHLRDITRLEGIEGDLLRNLAKVMNFRVNLSIPEEESVIRGFNVSTGCFAELATAKADLALGFLSSSDNLSSIFSYTDSYHQSPCVFVVPSGLHFGPLKQLAQAFCTEVWLCFGCCCIGGIIFIHLTVNKASRELCEKMVGKPSHSNATSLVVTMMGNPLKMLPRHDCARILLMAWLLATLVLRNAYQANMFDSLRISRRIPIPPSIAGLIEEKFALVSEKYVEFYPRNMTLVISNITRRYQIVQETESPRLTTLSMLVTLAWHNRQNWQTSRLAFVSEPIYQVQLSIFLKKHSKFRSFFNYRIKQLVTAGITAHFDSKHVKPHFLMLNAQSQRLPVIGSNMLKGLYMLYAILMGIAAALFIMEFLSCRSSFCKKIMDWSHSVKNYD